MQGPDTCFDPAPEQGRQLQITHDAMVGRIIGQFHGFQFGFNGGIRLY